VTRRECRHPASGLLPWYVSGSLHGAELDWVREHVRTCDICSGECDELGRAEGPLVRPAPRGRRVRRWMPWLVAAGLVLPLALGLYCIWAGTGSCAFTPTARLAPAVYLDLEAGPTRATDPLRSVKVPEDVRAVVISLLVPIAYQGVYTLDLEGPRGSVLVRQAPIRDIDEMGRCTYAFPATLLRTEGQYAIVVRVAAPDGDSRLYPYPFVVSPDIQRQSPAAMNAPQ
jgi:hypothetical protein